MKWLRIILGMLLLIASVHSLHHRHRSTKAPSDNTPHPEATNMPPYQEARVNQDQLVAF